MKNSKSIPSQFLLLVFLVIMNQSVAVSQSFWRNYSNDHLIEQMVDSDEKWYFATQGGLVEISKKDQSKIVYKPYNSPLKGAGISSLLVDKGGKLFIGTENRGLAIKDNQDWVILDDFVTPDFKSVNKITQVSDNTYFFSLSSSPSVTSSLRIGKYENSQIYIYNQLSIDKITSYASNSPSDFFISTQQGIIYNIKSSDGSIIDSFDLSDFFANLNDISIKDLEFDNLGNLVVLAQNTIYVKSGNNWSKINSLGSRKIIKDSEGILYFPKYLSINDSVLYGVYSQGVYTEVMRDIIPDIMNKNVGVSLLYKDIDGTFFYHHYLDPLSPKVWKVSNADWLPIDTQSDRLSTNYNRCVMTDCNGNVWVAGSNGVDVLKSDGWHHIPVDDGDPYSSFHSNDIALDENTCKLWITGAGNSWSATMPGIISIDGDSVTRYLIGETNVFDIKVGLDGTVWASTFDRIFKIKDNNVTEYPLSALPGTIGVTGGIEVGPEGELYICFRDSTVWKMQNDEFYFLGKLDQNGYNPFMDNNGLLWIMQNDGIVMYDGMNWHDYDHVFSKLNPSTMAEDQEGNYWISTFRQGVYFWNNEELRNYTVSNSDIGTNTVYDIYLDKTGGIWCTTSRDITLIQDESPRLASRITGQVFFDRNKSGTNDNVDEIGLSGHKIGFSDQSYWSYSGAGGNFTLYNKNSDNQSMFCNPLDNWILTTDSILSYNSIDTTLVQFGVFNDNLPENEAEVFIVNSPTICNEDFRISIFAINKGWNDIQGEITITYPSYLTLIDTLNRLKILSDTSAKIDVEILKLGGYSRMDIIANGVSETNLEEILTLKAELNIDTKITSFSTKDVVLCAYDPNDKFGYSEGISQGNISLKNDYLVYRIRFENEGNYKATDIVVIDTLDERLDIETFEYLASSHDCSIYIENNVVTFYFENINLPEYVENLTNNQGYILFKIRAKNSDGILDISNKAEIYFDHNPAIVTNTTNNKLVDDLLLEVEDSDFKGISIFPNPTSGSFSVQSLNDEFKIRVYNTSGKLLYRSKSFYSSGNFDLSLESGLYFVQLEYLQDGTFRKSSYQKLIIAK